MALLDAPVVNTLPTGRHPRWLARAYVFFELGVSTAGVIAAFALAARYGVDGFYIALFAGYLLITTFGVSAGMHRYFTHKSFSCKRWLEVVLALLSISAAQDYFVRWVSVHRTHHRLADQPGDPHSPYFNREGASRGLAALYHAHFGWLFSCEPDVDPKLVPDMLRDPLFVQLDRYSPLIVLVGVLLPGCVALLHEASVFSFVQGMLWGGLVRLFAMYHVTWSVNSLGHCYGGKVPDQKHGARNNLILGVMAFGDGWHANHHAHAASARHGFGWQQLDITYWILRAFEKVGWVWDMKLPPPADQKAYAAATFR